MDELLAQQVEYYRQRAPEYDDWWERRGSYSLPAEVHEQWVHDTGQVQRAVHKFRPTGRVLELACGTGLFTRHLVAHADHVTAVDTSPEVIEINRARLPGAGVEYVVGDVFAWPFPEAAYDAVVFTYWLSHVPDGHLDSFWRDLGRTLKESGRVFMVDSAPYRPVTRSAPSATEERELQDGRTFTVVKRYWDPTELEADLTARGWECEASLTDNSMILYAQARLVRKDP